VSQAEVYWFDDTPSDGECRPPSSWRLLALVGGHWKDVSSASAYGVEENKMNVVTFSPVSARKFRIEAQLKPKFSAGILEWKLE
jgi:hypothetical protein